MADSPSTWAVENVLDIWRGWVRAIVMMLKSVSPPTSMSKLIAKVDGVHDFTELKRLCHRVWYL